MSNERVTVAVLRPQYISVRRYLIREISPLGRRQCELMAGAGNNVHRLWVKKFSANLGSLSSHYHSTPAASRHASWRTKGDEDRLARASSAGHFWQ